MNNKDFRSDNVSPPAPEILDAALRDSRAWMDAYSDDQITGRVEERLAAIFECDVAAFPILTGTAANALALATISGRFGQILCHRSSHINMDECGAVEFYTQGNRLKPLEGEGAKLDVATCVRGFGTSDDIHQLRTTAVSISQATEFGTYYAVEQVAQLGSWTKSRGVGLHMDGTRFANVVAASGSDPAELTWRSGVDVLCLGATKGGAIGAEVVVFFDREKARDFKRLMKRSGHLASRLWFLASQLDAYFRDDLWTTAAHHANAMAKRLDEALRQNSSLTPHFPVQTNMVFLKLAGSAYEKLQASGVKFYVIDDEKEGPLARFVTSYATEPDDVDRLAETITGIARGSA
ncbi:low specificity L-threonine aldolase [Shinella daejeonensis]|uniref:threonine aldolase family protein n=1 Tax=Shinella daejeonensis TaxID=659017 RepID=UPI0020C82467|nr:beta-eliminating lyase-related protein [Shinella daejeonensis]MCP8894932.1 low specificity L-threonine aldolase [Shinella daejeonensis]